MHGSGRRLWAAHRRLLLRAGGAAAEPQALGLPSPVSGPATPPARPQPGDRAFPRGPCDPVAEARIPAAWPLRLGLPLDSLPPQGSTGARCEPPTAARGGPKGVEAWCLAADTGGTTRRYA